MAGNISGVSSYQQTNQILKNKNTYTPANFFGTANKGKSPSSGLVSGGNDMREKLRALSENEQSGAAVQNTGTFSKSVLGSSQSYGDSLRMQRQNAKQTSNALKQLKYRFKDISTKLIRSKTSAAARQVAGQARREVLRLKRQRQSGEYDSEELEAAIAHAKAVERVAKKKVRHLEEEEMAKASGGPCAGDTIEDEQETEEKTAEEELQAEEPDHSEPGMTGDDCADAEFSGMDTTEQMPPSEISDLFSDMETMTPDILVEITDGMQDLFDETKEGMRQMLEEMGLDELTDSLVAAKGDMDPADLKEMKIKHRNKEMKELTKADAEYLKAVFDHLQKAKEGAAVTRFSGDSATPSQPFAAFSPSSAPITSASAAEPVLAAVIDITL